MLLIPNQIVNVVFAREPFCDAVFMLPDALDEVTCDADVERAVGFVGQQIDKGIFRVFRNE